MPVRASVLLFLLALLPGCLDSSVSDPTIACDTELGGTHTVLHCLTGDDGAAGSQPGCGDQEAKAQFYGVLARGSAHITVSASDADGSNPGAPLLDEEIQANWHESPRPVTLASAPGYLVSAELEDFNGDLTVRVDCV
jgi:hypothetical protein